MSLTHPADGDRARRGLPVTGWLAGLFLLACVPYLGALDHGFLNYDDRAYVLGNPMVRGGLTLEGLSWALTSASYACNWHPTTWASHMLDATLFGADATDARGHHATSVALHGTNAVLLALALGALTGSRWRSLAVAALFAVHPLRVESVAWIAERKDVLSGTFFCATLLAYARWVRARGAGRYAVVLTCLALGLMAKPMLVTLPFLLLVLDRWPLARPEPWRRLVAEKLPLFALVAGSAAMTLVAQRAGGCTEFVRGGIEVGSRVGNAAAALVRYVAHTLWPVDLAVFYPHPAVVAPDTSRAPVELAAGALVLAATVGAFALRRRVPALLVGWLWFCGLLVPVLGLVQVGGQALADRYAYLPTVGLYLAAVWGARALVARRGALLRPLLVAFGALLAALAVTTARQVEVWRDDRTLFEHALAVTDDNYVAHVNLGRLDAEAERHAAARAHLEAAVAIEPTFWEARYNLGLLLRITGASAAARPHLEETVRLRPGDADARFELGVVLLDLGLLEEAEGQLLEARRLDPDHPVVDQALEILQRRRTRDG